MFFTQISLLHRNSEDAFHFHASPDPLFAGIHNQIIWCTSQSLHFSEFLTKPLGQRKIFLEAMVSSIKRVSVLVSFHMWSLLILKFPSLSARSPKRPETTSKTYTSICQMLINVSHDLLYQMFANVKRQFVRNLADKHNI